MGFEFDHEQSQANLTKHGIDFERAQALWDDPRLLEVPARSEDEPRFVAIGRIGVRHWAAIFTWRGTSRRLISVRRARLQEIDHYEGE